MKQRKSAFKRQRKANPRATEFRDLMTAAFHAADEMGLDWVAIMREQLQTEGVLPKKEDENP